MNNRIGNPCKPGEVDVISHVKKSFHEDWMSCSRVSKDQSCPEMNQRQNLILPISKIIFSQAFCHGGLKTFFYMGYCPKTIGFQPNRLTRCQT